MAQVNSITICKENLGSKTRIAKNISAILNDIIVKENINTYYGERRCEKQT